jgi:outer membrane protein OmpA-like peptidoglycan-associated protein
VIRWSAVGLSLVLIASVDAAEVQQRFVTCPVYRDTDAGRKSGCWLATDPVSGLRYDVSLAPTKPDWNHAVLVEGLISADPGQACGAPVLNPVRVSVLPDGCTRHMLPAEGFPGRKYKLPPRNVQPLSVPREPPAKPFMPKTFYLFYDFNSDFGIYQLDDYFLDRAANYIDGTAAHEVVVTGFAATSPSQVSGRTLAENPDIARQRSQSVAESLRRLSTRPYHIVVKWKKAANPIPVDDADGLVEPSRRRVEIEVRP